MYLSVYILSDYLADLSPLVLKGHRQQLTISGVSLYEPGAAMQDNILYLGPADQVCGQETGKIACANHSNVLILDTEDMLIVLKRTLECFNHFSDWYNDCEASIFNNVRLHELIGLFQRVFHNPIAVLNSDKKFIAYSQDYLEYIPAEDKVHVLEHRSLSDERLKEFSQKFGDTFFCTDVYSIPAGFFPTKGYCKHIFLNNERVATVICKAPKGNYSTGELHLIGIIAEFVRRWIQQNQHNKRITFPPLAYFTRTLEGDASALAVFVHKLAVLGWSANCRKQFFLLGSNAGVPRLDHRQLHQLTGSNLGIQAIAYQEKLIILCDLDLVHENEFINNLRNFVKEARYYCASSFVFTQQEKIISAYRQALTAFDNCPHETGKTYSCQDIAMRIIANIVSNYTPTDFRHPSLGMMKDYDDAHQTEYYKTLITFLKNERRLNDTANELMIHRNTLASRIDKMKSLWPLDLDNFELRTFLVFSVCQDIFSE